MGPELALNPGLTSALQAELLSWISTRLRQLPWRDTRDPWAVLVSEVMLQQTGVQRVFPKWQKFIDLFPDPQTCADAELGDVLRLWQGLGYPRRARNLHLAAQQIVSHHGGMVPSDLEDLLALPGIGAYTARAVQAFAFELDAAVVDVNVARILARLGGQRLTARQAQSFADGLVPDGEAWLWNQALMDLGAMTCRPVAQCQQCPLQTWCSWQGNGPDPSHGSAGIGSPQSRFEGSDRQARGRLIKVLGQRNVDFDEVSDIMDRPQPTAERLVAALVQDGLIRVEGRNIML